MTRNPQKILFLYLVLLNSCTVSFIPQIEEEKELLVVQGLITDQPEPGIIKLSKSLPLGEVSAARPVSGCVVTITDDLGNPFILTEITAGTYITPSSFRGEIGRFYTLHINTNSDFNHFNYESNPMEMIPVPPIDSIYYQKTVIEKENGFFKGVDGCQIYLDSYDPENKCRFYRWNFSETWKLRLPFEVTNNTCWISDKSQIIIKSTAAFKEARISRFPIKYISNISDRLKTKYSIMVNQYSLNEDEYIYWEKIQNIAVQVGGLYDVIPASVPSNIRCIEAPAEKVLGYFSVSAISSKRIFIKDKFNGIIDLYAKCATDTLIGGGPIDSTSIPGLGISVWTLFNVPGTPFGSPGMIVLTRTRGCADCTVRGTTVKPVFWTDDK